MDIYSSEKRRSLMARVSGEDTAPEILTRQYLFRAGFRYRKNVKELPSRPDIVLPKYKAVVFVHGCFWHQHKGCRKSKRPETRKNFWAQKLDANIERDRRNIEELKKMGWRVAIVWECATNKKAEFDKAMLNLVRWIISNEQEINIP